MDDDLQKKSLHLYDVLEAVGACENIRWKFKDNATANEICDTVAVSHTNEPCSKYTFGSQIEGATTQGLNSDSDSLVTNETTPAIESIQDGSHLELCYLIVTDETIQPGYAKLQMVHNGLPQKVYNKWMRSLENIDHEGRICVKHFCTIGLVSKVQQRNGPADTVPETPGLIEADYVSAYRCGTIPRTANMWIYKDRPYNWPSRDQVMKMSTFSCFFVGKGHPKSKRPSIEWRISFSLQERYLMLGLNTIQHKCYIFLKMVKKDIIHPITGKSISSYHCKTCLFYTIENTESSFWIPKNLIQATRLCIVRLLQWTNEKNCPNFFVPDENMFDRLKHETLGQVAVVLEDILSSGMEFISWIECDDVGALFFNTISGSDLEVVKSLNKAKLYNFLYSNNVGNIYAQRNDFLRRRIPYMKSPEECLNELVKLLKLLQNTDRVTEHTREEVRKALDPVLPHVHLQIAQSLAAQMVSVGGLEDAKIFAEFKHHTNEGKNSDLISYRLTMATYLLQHDRVEECEMSLQQCVFDLRPFVTTMCRCHDYALTENYQILFDKFCKENLSIHDFRRRCITGCMVFLPSQACLVHQALRYEMFRSVFTQPNSRNASTENWFDWVVVDSKVYLFFLLYVLYSKTNKQALQQNAMERLLDLIEDQNLGHRDTFYNLLGWIFFHENKIQEACLFLSFSWRFRPNHNAAKWHLAMFCYKHYKVNTK